MSMGCKLEKKNKGFIGELRKNFLPIEISPHRQWYWLHTDVLQYPPLGVFKAQLDKALRNLL